MVLGVHLLVVGSRYPRLSSFCMAWLCLGALLYFIVAVSGGSLTAALVVGFVVPVVALAPPIALLPPLARCLLAVLVCFICWLGFHTIFPHALSSSPVGLYLLLALPAVVFAVVGVVLGPVVTFVVGCPIVGVFLAYQGVAAFIHQPWLVLFALDQQSTRLTCDEVDHCYEAFAVAVVAAAAGIAWQAFLASRLLNKDADPTAVLSGKLAIPMQMATLGTAPAASFSAGTPAAAAAPGGAASAGNTAVASAVVPLYSLGEVTGLSDGHAAGVVVSLAASSIPVAAVQHIVVVDAPAPPLSYPTAPVPMLLPHPPSSDGLHHYGYGGLFTAPPGGQRWGTEPMAGSRAGAGGDAKSAHSGEGEDEEEDEGGGQLPPAEEGGRRWGSHVSVGSKRGATPQPPVWMAVYDYEQPEEDQLRATASREELRSHGSDRFASPVRGDSRGSEADGSDAAVDAAADLINDDGGAPSRSMYDTMHEAAGFNVTYSATLTDEPMQLTVHEPEISATATAMEAEIFIHSLPAQTTKSVDCGIHSTF